MRETMQSLALLKALYPHTPVAPETIQAYAQLLGDIEPSHLKAAVVEFAATGGKFFPTVAELRELATRDREMPDMDQVLAEIQTAIGRYGRYRQPQFSHPAIYAAVESFGWPNLCNTLDEDWPTTRAQLRDAFNVAKVRTNHGRNMQSLASGPMGGLLEGLTKQLTEGKKT